MIHFLHPRPPRAVDPHSLDLGATYRTVAPLSDARACVAFLELFHGVRCALAVHPSGTVTLAVPGCPDTTFTLPAS